MRKVSIVLLVGFSLLLTACFGGGSSNTADQFHVGTQGLAISFIQNEPPSRIVIENNANPPPTANFGIQLSNLGAEDIKGGVLVYSGFDSNLVTWHKSDQIPSLQGKSFSNPQGSKEIVENNGNIVVAQIGEVYRPAFEVTACYNYQTNAQIPICIDPDPTGKSPKPCSAQGFSASGGQGAPLAVTAIEQNPSKGKTLFKITIKNSGGGDVFQGDVNNCLPGGTGLTYKDLDKVKFGSVTLGKDPLRCQGIDASGSIPLTSGQGVIFCTADNLQKGSSFQTTMNILLEYNYRTSVSKSIEIVKLS